MDTFVIILGGAAVIAAAVPISMIVEALRPRPHAPGSLYWDPAIPIRHASIGGMRIRYVTAGSGPDLVLLHTMRTQLDIFETLIPKLVRDFTVYALDYPGHGFSDIPDSDYRPELFVDTVEKFLEQMGIDNATVAGISIGGVIPLLMAAKQNPRVAKVVSINPYDYDEGGGIRRANLTARLIFTLAEIPVIGETVMRLRNSMIERKILEGGVFDRSAVSKKFAGQIVASGARKGHYRAFLRVVRAGHYWNDAHGAYPRIKVPVLVIYGDEDWSKPEERRRTISEIPGANSEQIPRGGHFLSLDQPERLASLIRRFANRRPTHEQSLAIAGVPALAPTR
jgi:pimeloyl-ACP methyl ester carboxylesterase